MIQTSIHQKDIPEAVIRDSRGTLISEGLRVAYNYQGSVAIGKIISCVSTWKSVRGGVEDKMWWSSYFTLKILNENGFISTVKNPNSFVIIYTPLNYGA